MPQNFIREVRRMKDFARKNNFKGLKDFHYAYAYGYRYSDYSKDPSIFSANWYNLPDVNLVMNQLTEDWQADKLPLSIELEDEKIKITHTSLPSSPVTLTLFPETAYLLGFAESLDDPNGRVLTFTDNSSKYAPHVPHGFADLVEEKLRHLLRQLEAPADIVYKMHDIYNKMINMMEEKMKEKDQQCLEAKNKLEQDKDSLCETSKISLLEDHHHELNELHVKTEDTINNLRRFYEREMLSLNNKHDSEVSKQAKEFNDQMDLTIDSHNKEMNRMKQEHQQELIDNQTVTQHLKEMDGSQHKVDMDELNVHNQNSLGMVQEEPMIVDFKDRVDKHITSIQNFDEDAMTYSKWNLKGVIIDSTVKDIGDNESLFVVKLQDYSGTIEIAGFGKNGTEMGKFLEVGKQYYVEMVERIDNGNMDLDEIVKMNDVSPTNLTVTIHNTSFKVKFVEV